MVSIGEIKIKAGRYVILGGVIITIILIFGLFWFLVIKPQYTPPQFKLVNSGLSAKTRQYAVEKIIQSGNFEECRAAEGLVMDGVDYSVVCRNNIASQQALTKLDMTYCDQLDDKLMSRESCRLQVIVEKVRQGASEQSCRDLASPYDKLCHNEYLGQQAIIKSDVSFCERLEDARAREVCRNNVFVGKLLADPAKVSCDDFPASLYDDCKFYKDVAAGAEKNSRRCTIIDDPRVQTACENFLLGGQR